MSTSDEDLIRAVESELKAKLAREKDSRDELKNPNRRSFLKITGVASASLIIASIMPSRGLRAEELGSLVGSAELNAFIKVSSDGRIVIYSANPEMGQGIKTALPMIVAEEMGAKWEDVEVLQAPIDERFGTQRAGGSTTIPRSFNLMRQMGASAREMFIGAASEAMELPREELNAHNSAVSHLSGRSLSFGETGTAGPSITGI